MRSSKPWDNESHCLRCYMRREICICSILPTVQTQMEFLILRHVQESGRPSNTGRLVALTMPKSRILSCGGGDRLGLSSIDEELLRKPGTWLLWPDEKNAGSVLNTVTPDRILVLDATWRQARRLLNRIPVLQTMPRLVLRSPSPDRKRLREQNRSDGMSTIEAVAAAISRLEGAQVAEPLENLFDEVVRRRINWRRKGKSGCYLL